MTILLGYEFGQYTCKNHCDVKEMILIIKPCTYKSASEWGLPFVPTFGRRTFFEAAMFEWVVGRAAGGDDDK